MEAMSESPPALQHPSEQRPAAKHVAEQSADQHHLPDSTPMQLLNEHGQRVHDERYTPYLEALSSEDLREFYRDMVLVRRFDAEATALQRQGELGLWPPSLGQEGAQVGSGRAMAARDYAFPSYREHAVAHTRGMDLAKLLPLFRGQDHGGWDPNELNFHLYTLVIGSQTLHATGYAMGITRDGDVGTGDPDRDRAVVVYFGDGATSQGDVHEAMVFAAVNDAPVVFFCQNNGWAISEPVTRQSRAPLAQRAQGIGIPSVRIDGNDVLASYAATTQALEHARSGSGPMMIEAITYRMGAHTTSDDPTKYRSRAEEDLWRGRDPIDRLHTLLVNEGADQAFFDGVQADADELAEYIRDACRAIKPPAHSAIFEHVYATEHTRIAAEQRWFEDYQAGFEEE